MGVLRNFVPEYSHLDWSPSDSWYEFGFSGFPFVCAAFDNFHNFSEFSGLMIFVIQAVGTWTRTETEMVIVSISLVEVLVS